MLFAKSFTPFGVVQLLIISICFVPNSDCLEYYGKRIGQLSTLAHDLNGNVFSADDGHIIVTEFIYDGTGPDAFFWVGKSAGPDSSGVLIPLAEGTPVKLSAYSNEIVRLRLPNDHKFSDRITYFGVWCRRFQANFGFVLIDANFQVPKPRIVAGFVGGQHGISSSGITYMDEKTVVLSGFNFDGEGPPAHFVAGIGEPITDAILATGIRVREKPLSRYTAQDITLTLPDTATIQDFGWLAVYCAECPDGSRGYANVTIPNDLNDIPAHIDLSDEIVDPGSGSGSETDQPGTGTGGSVQPDKGSTNLADDFVIILHILIVCVTAWKVKA